MNFCRIYNKVRRILNGKDYKPVDNINVILGLIIILADVVLNPIVSVLSYLWRTLKLKMPKINWGLFFIFILYISIVVLIAMMASFSIQGRSAAGIVAAILLVWIEILVTGCGLYEIKEIDYDWTTKYLRIGLLSPIDFFVSSMEKIGMLTTSHCNLKEKK